MYRSKRRFMVLFDHEINVNSNQAEQGTLPYRCVSIYNAVYREVFTCCWFQPDCWLLYFAKTSSCLLPFLSLTFTSLKTELDFHFPTRLPSRQLVQCRGCLRLGPIANWFLCVAKCKFYCECCLVSAERWVLMFVAASLTAHWDWSGLECSWASLVPSHQAWTTTLTYYQPHTLPLVCNITSLSHTVSQSRQ